MAVLDGQEEEGSSSFELRQPETVSGYLGDLERYVNRPGTSERCYILKEYAFRFVSGIHSKYGNDSKNEEVERLVKDTISCLAVNTLSTYTDKDSRRAVYSLLVKLMQLFPKETGAALGMCILERSNAKQLGALGAVEMFNLINWSSLLTINLFSVISKNEKFFSKMILSQEGLLRELQRLSLNRPKVEKMYCSGLMVIGSIFRLNAEAASAYLKMISAAAANSFPNLIGAICKSSGSETKIEKANFEQLKSNKDKLISIFVEVCLESKIRLEPKTVESFSGVLVLVDNSEEFKKMIYPALNKGFLRNPEVIIRAMPCLMRYCSTTMDSKLLVEVCLKICDCFHYEDSMTRICTAEAMKNAFKCMGAFEDEILKVLEYMLNILKGTKTKLSNIDCRVNLIKSMQSSCERHWADASEKSESISTAYSSFLEGFIMVLQKESNELPKLTGIECCGALLNENPKAFGDGFAKQCLLILKSSTASVTVKEKLLRAIKPGLLSMDSNKSSKSIIDHVFNTVMKIDRQLIVSGFGEALISLSIVINLLTQSKSEVVTKDASFKEKFEKNVLDILTSSKLALSLSDECLKEMFCLLMDCIDDPYLCLNLDSQNIAISTIVSLLFMPGRTHVRANVRAVLRQRMEEKTSSRFGALLMKHVENVYFNDAEESLRVKYGISLHELGVILQSCLVLDRLNENDKVDALLSLILVTYHPDVVIKSQLGSKMPLELKSSFVKHLLDPSNVASKNGTRKYATLQAIKALCRSYPEEYVATFMGYVSQSIDVEAINEFDEYACGVFYTKPGELYDRSITERLRERNEENARNRARQYGNYSREDELWEQQLREEMSKKRGQKKDVKLTKQQQERVDSLKKKEAEIRANVKAVHAVAGPAFDVLLSLESTGVNALTPFLPKLANMLFDLRKSPLFSEQAVRCFVNLTQCLPPRHRKLCKAILCCVLHLEGTYVPIGQSIWDGNPKSILHEVSLQMKDLSYGVMNSGTFVCALPFVEIIFKSNSFSVEERDVCCSVIESYLKLMVSGEMPRTRLLKLLSYVIYTHNRYQSRASELLVKACEYIGSTSKSEEQTVLLDGLISEDAKLRGGCLKGLIHFSLPSSPTVISRVWISVHDEDEDNAEVADQIWQSGGFKITDSSLYLFMEHIISDIECIRTAAGYALASGLQENASCSNEIIAHLIETFDKCGEKPPEYDELGNVSKPSFDPWWSRAGIAMCLSCLSVVLKVENIPLIFNFFIQKGFCDLNEGVRKQMLESCLKVIESFGADGASDILNIFEKYLASPAPDSEIHDRVRESVIICLGASAVHLEKGHPKVPPVVEQLMATLNTPSEPVQEAAAKCLAPLMASKKPEAPAIIKKLLDNLLEGEKYAERRGAAFGLAGAVKGFGILTLKQQNVITTLQEAVVNKKKPKHREGALFAFDTLSRMLGRLFEPYVIHILPNLLVCLSDGNVAVREAANDAARTIMGQLSAHGVKLVLPSLTKGLEDDAWRTKQGSAELLGAMAYCAPKQLSSCLPQVVPKLRDTLTDSHIKVQEAGSHALKEIGSVIRNPELLAIASNMVDALSDPERKTMLCLEKLLSISFVHFIDAPSLALLMPILERALKERGTETKKMAAQVIGNMSSLTDHKDLAPYLPSILPGLKGVLLDPVPQVRAISAKALGTMVRGLGESKFSELIPWLIETMKSESSSVDRSGAAQGLCEVILGIGVEKLAQVLPEACRRAENSSSPYERDGYLLLFVYLPDAFGDAFKEYISSCLPSILKGLADESEFVRHASFRAGQMFVNRYAETCVDIFLPELESGLVDPNWRIRQSSVQLLGDLLYAISGTSGKGSTLSAGDDDNFGTAEVNAALVRSLGAERRDKILAGLYMARSDISPVVRQSSLHVWKTIVVNTARTLREILPILMNIMLSCLASKSYDRRTVAARTLGDLVKKLGERVLPIIIPIMEKGLNSENASEREGVCIGLSEIMTCTHEDQVLNYIADIIPCVKRALCDPLEDVREAASHTFDKLHVVVGSRAIDEVIPGMLALLADEEVGDFCLHGLQRILSVKSHVVLPFLIPKLIAPPQSKFQIQALGALASVAGTALNRHIPEIVPALLNAVSRTKEDERDAMLSSAKQVVLAVASEDGAGILLGELMDKTKSDVAINRCTSSQLIDAFCSNTRLDFSRHIPSLINCLLLLFNDEDDTVVYAAWRGLDAVTKQLSKDELVSYISHTRRSMKQLLKTVDGEVEELKGFSLNKGISPILPMFLHGLIYGSPEVREQSAAGLGDLISLTSPAALKPFVIQITGPLIRVVGDKFTWQVKSAILGTLGILIEKAAMMLKPFLPQLQSTFQKALLNPTKLVRTKAAESLASFVQVLSGTDLKRITSILTELASSSKKGDDVGVRESQLGCLYSCAMRAEANLNDTIRTACMGALLDNLSDPEPNVKRASAYCIGALSLHCADYESLCSVFLKPIMTSRVNEVGVASALSDVFRMCKCEFDVDEDILNFCLDLANSASFEAKPAAVATVGFLATHVKDAALEDKIVGLMTSSLSSTNTEEKVTTLDALNMYIEKRPVESRRYLTSLIPAFMVNVRERTVSVKLVAEKALYQILNLKVGTSIMDEYVKANPGQATSTLQDYYKRVLSRKQRKTSVDDSDAMPFDKMPALQ
eukprot:Nk52_evm47s2391 gene=Nk52_evmTU47s2391